MYCPDCGSENKDDDSFCTVCGSALTAPVAQPEISEPVTTAGKKPAFLKKPDGLQSSSNKRLLGWIAVAVVIIGGSFATFHFLTTPTRLETTFETIPFTVATSTDENLLEGVSFTKSPGQNGNMQIKTKIWLGENDVETGRKVVSTNTLIEPVDEVVVEGGRSSSEVSDDVESLARTYLDSWKNADYAAMVGVSASDSLNGYSIDNISNAYSTSGEVLESYMLGDSTVSSMEDLILSQKDNTGSSYGNEDTDSMNADDFAFGSQVVAQVPVTFTTNSRATGRVVQSEMLRFEYMDGAWKLIYPGQLMTNAVNQSQRMVRKGYSEDQTMDVVVDYVIVYRDHTVLAVHETNTTHSKYGSSSFSSWFDSLSSYSYSDEQLMTDDSSSGQLYKVDEKKTSDFDYSVKEGATQSGHIYLTPGIPADARSITLTFNGGYSETDAVFNGIAIR